MSIRTTFIIASLVAAGAAALIMTLRSAESPPSAKLPTRAKAPAEDPTAPTPGRWPPERPALTLAPGTPSEDRPRPMLTVPAASAFEDEERDATWAAQHEREVRARIETLVAEEGGGIVVTDIECRSQRCRFQLGGREDSFQSFVEILQGDRGFHQDATELLLQNYQAATVDRPEATVQVVLRYGAAAQPTSDGPEPPE